MTSYEPQVVVAFVWAACSDDYSSTPTMIPVLAILSLALVASAQQQNSSSSPNILLFTRTVGFRHDSIPTAIDVITRLGTGDITPREEYLDPATRDARWTTINSEDDSKFEDADYLKQFKAVVFAFTT